MRISDWSSDVCSSDLIGTGTGRILEILADKVAHAVGIDLSPDMLMLARSKLERARLRNCVVRKGDMNHLPLGEASFDAVTVHQVLHYAERPARTIEEAARVLRSEEHTSELQSLMRISYAVF